MVKFTILGIGSRALDFTKGVVIPEVDRGGGGGRAWVLV